jgi:hypothetical protein
MLDKLEENLPPGKKDPIVKCTFNMRQSTVDRLTLIADALDTNKSATINSLINTAYNESFEE